MRKKNQGIWVQALKANWHLMIVMALIIAGAAALALRPTPQPSADAAAIDMQVETRTTLESHAPEKSRWAKPTRAEAVQDAIDHYTQEIEFNVGSEETPDNLYRLANLYYSELHDFDKASLHYLTLIQDYPDYRGMQTIYANLLNCYDQLGQPQFKRRTLEQMKAHFGEGSQEYQFAEQELRKL